MGLLEANNIFSYRFSFNGKESDDEVSGSGNSYDYGFRIYNPRLGKFLSVDPLTKSYPSLTPYQFAANMPIVAIDLDGLEAVIKINSVYISNAFCRIQAEDGTKAAVSYLLKNKMGQVHSADGLSWIGTITNGTANRKVIIVGDKPGLPEELIIYTLELTGEGTAAFIENKFHVTGELEEMSWIEEFKSKIGWPWIGEAPPRKVRRATWLEEGVKENVDFDKLKEISEILQKRQGASPLSPHTIEFEPTKIGEGVGLDEIKKPTTVNRIRNKGLDTSISLEQFPWEIGDTSTFHNRAIIFQDGQPIDTIDRVPNDFK